MKKTPRQPTMEEWLLDSLHGPHDGEDEESLELSPTHFINPLTYKYACAFQRKKSSLGIVQQIKSIISHSIWPRILIARCRALLATALPLCSTGHWIIMDSVLNCIRVIMHYVGILCHGLRLLLNLSLLLAPLFANSPQEETSQAVSHSWLELFIDSHSLISAFLPANYLITSCALSVLELGVFASHGWLEYRHIASYKESFGLELTKNNLTQTHYLELKKSETHAKAFLNHKVKKLILNLTTMTASILLFVIKHSLSVALLTNPLVPLLFAVVALGLSLANHFISQYLDKEKPKVKMSDLSGNFISFKKYEYTFFTTDARAHIESFEANLSPYSLPNP